MSHVLSFMERIYRRRFVVCKDRNLFSGYWERH